MWKIIILVTLLANLDSAFTESIASVDYLQEENSSSTSGENSNSSSDNSSSYTSTSTNNESYECGNESQEGEQPNTTPGQPTTNPDQPTTTPGQPSTKPADTSNALDKFDKGNIKFTANFFDNVVKANPGKSVIMSSYSTEFLIAALALRGDGITAEEILKALNFSNKDEIRSALPATLNSIEEQKNVTLTLAARVFGNKRSNFSPDFKAESKKILGAEAENIDFTDPQVAAQYINQWVADKTNNKIRDLIPANLLSPETELVLTNAFHFRGDWLSPFNPDSTSPSEFYTQDNKTIMVDTMNQVKYFKYAEIEKLNAQALELPYVNDNLTCLIILPKDKNGAPALVSKLVNEVELTSVRSSLEYERVAVSLPKFNSTTTTDLKDIFIKLNITAIFDPEISNLNNILADSRKVYVTAAIQKATIEVFETGAEAAAGNAIIGVGITSVPAPPVPFTANRSFIYYLLFRGYPIFCGLFAGN